MEKNNRGKTRLRKTISKILCLGKFLRLEQTNCFIRFKFGMVNFYFSYRPLSSRNGAEDKGRRKKLRRKLKWRLLTEKGCCEQCGKPLDWLSSSVHHIVPKRDDPSREFDYENLRLLCVECHENVHRFDYITMRRTLKEPSHELQS